MTTKDIMALADEYRHTISGSVEARQKLEAAVEAALAPQQVPEGYKLLKDSTHDERSYPEDAKHENGWYNNVCGHCWRGFAGHKRRGVCKVCAAAPQPAPQPAKWVGLTRDDRECVFFEADSAMKTDINLAWRNAILDAAEAKLREKIGDTA